MIYYIIDNPVKSKVRRVYLLRITSDEVLWTTDIEKAAKFAASDLAHATIRKIEEVYHETAYILQENEA